MQETAPEPDATDGEPEETGDDELEDENGDSSLVYVTFSGGIVPETVDSLLGALAYCANEDFDEVHLLLSTYGGSVTSGITLYNILRGFPFHLVTHNAGTVASIGVAVYLAGDERLACANSRFSLHGVTFHPLPEQTFTAAALREQRDNILADEAKTNSILADRTSIDAERLQKYAESEQTMSAEDAVKDGIADRVEEIEIPPEAYVLTVK